MKNPCDWINRYPLRSRVVRPPTVDCMSRGIPYLFVDSSPIPFVGTPVLVLTEQSVRINQMHHQDAG